MTKTPPAPPPIQCHHLKQTSLSYSQESLWFLQQLDPGNSAYNSNYQIRITGGIDRHIMEQALNVLVRRHESLRTTFPNQGGKPVQVIRPFEAFSIPFEDFSGLPEDELEQVIHHYISKLGNQPFDLQKGPIIRFALLHNAQKWDTLFFSIHHISFDAWSRHIFISELMQVYDALRSGKEPVLPELPIQYGDYSAWQREWLSGETMVAYIEHWKTILSGDLPILEIPTDRPRPAIQTFRGARYHFRFPPGISSRMKGFCQSEHMTLFQLLLAAYALLLMRHSGQEDIIIGCPFSNRSRPELDGLVGLFVNTLPIRVNLQGNPNVREFLNQVHTVMLEAYPWQVAPFEALVSDISPQRDLSRTPVFQAVINMKNVPKRRTSIEGLELMSYLQEDSPSQFDIALEFDVGEDGELDASLHYNVDLFDENSIIYMSAHYQNLLGELLTKTDRPIADLEMLTPSEVKRIVIDWNDTVTDYPREKCIHQLFEEYAENAPDSPAIVFAGRELTYRQLNSRANQLAHSLCEMGIRSELRVGLYIERSSEMIIALLAILKAGGAYVPLDMAYPSKQQEFILRDTKSPLLLTLRRHLPNLPSFDGKVVCLDDEAIYNGNSEKNPCISMVSENLAYVMYTSGSTGLPKGTCIPHRAVVRLVKNTNYFHVSLDEVFLQFAPLAFDASTFEIWGGLLNGAKLVIFPPHLPSPDELSRFVDTSGVTTLWLTAGLFHQIMESQPGIVNHLHQLLSGGDVLSPTHVRMALQQNPNCRLINGYGPTENTTFTCCYTIKEPSMEQSVPIGRPIANTSVYILDAYRRPVPVRVVGELYIGGDGLAREYLNQPELTNLKFVPNHFSGQAGARLYRTGDYVRWLPDGNIEFLGRMDKQVKLRGYRIELGEIEAAIGQFPDVYQAIVLMCEDQPWEKRLVAYIIPTSGTTLDSNKLRGFLREKLPGYMVPSAFVLMDAFPLTVNGKVNQQALPRPERGAEADQSLKPRNDIETRLVSIWKEILGVAQVGIRDNFFDLGGHSLMAVSLFSRIEAEFGQYLPLVLLFKDGTVEAIARILGDEERPTHPPGIVQIQPEGLDIPLFFVSPSLYMRDLAILMAPGRPVYGVDPVENGKVVYRKSVQETARIYYHNLVNYYPQGPYLLLGHSANGYFTLELARLLINNGKEVAFVGMLDTFPPGPKHQQTPIDRVKIHIHNLKNKNLTEIMQYFVRSFHSFSGRWRRRVTVKEKKIVQHEKIGQEKEEIRDLILSTYNPEPYEGKVTLFSAAEHRFYIPWDPMEPWTNIITGQLDVLPISGDHGSMLENPQVNELARKIDGLLPRRKNA